MEISKACKGTDAIRKLSYVLPTHLLLTLFSRSVATVRGVAKRGAMPPPPPPQIQFPYQTRSTNFSFLHQEYCFLPMFRNYTDQKFHNIYRVCYNFWTIYGSISFFLTTMGKQITSRWTFYKGPILNARASEKFLFVDHLKQYHNEGEFKSEIIGEILDLPKNTATKYVRRPQWTRV